MIIYYAGMNREKTALFTAVKSGCRHLMLSYYFDKNNIKQLIRYRKLGLHIFMDSGAYSAWTKKVEIDIDEYIKFIKNHHIGKYIVLDVVGNPKQTYDNLKHMESNGLQPIPVFHFGSDFKYLQQLVDENYYYICLGGTVGASTKNKIEFFDKCFKSFPNTYFHGLGMTQIDILLKYPWFSVDSTAWLNGRKYSKLATFDGQIDLPKSMPTQDKIAKNVQFFSDLELFSL